MPETLQKSANASLAIVKAHLDYAISHLAAACDESLSAGFGETWHEAAEAHNRAVELRESLG